MKHTLTLISLCAIILIFPAFASASKTHRVKKKETVYSLAKKYHVTAEELKAANNIVGNKIKPHTTLVIPPRTVASGTSVSSVYKVKRSEPLARIAKKTGVSVAELKRLNGLSGNRVKAGRTLVLKEQQPVVAEETHVRPAPKKLALRHADLFNEKEYEQGLQELADLAPEDTVDLRKNTELKVDSVRELKKAAYGFLGTPYRFGGTSRGGLDCSAFVQKVFRDLSVSLPRTAREQFEVGSAVAPGDLQKGDLIFFSTYASYASHVGIYLGNNKMIHASSRDHRVVISPMNTPYYRSRFLGAKRIARVNPGVFRLDDLILGVEEEVADDAADNDTLGLNQ